MTSADDVQARRVVFRAKNPMSLGVPAVIQWLMIIVFGFPTILPLLTWKLVPGIPWVVILWPICFFPWLVLYGCARLISRYALIVYANGNVEITYPFSVATIRSSELVSVVSDRHYLEATQSYVTWVRFVDRSGKILASLSPIAFSPETFSLFLRHLAEVKPDLQIGV